MGSKTFRKQCNKDSKRKTRSNRSTKSRRNKNGKTRSLRLRKEFYNKSRRGGWPFSSSAPVAAAPARQGDFCQRNCEEVADTIYKKTKDYQLSSSKKTFCKQQKLNKKICPYGTVPDVPI